MLVKVQGKSYTSQTFTQFRDVYGLLERNGCGPVQYSLQISQSGSAITLPDSVVSLSGYTIVLNGTDAQDYIGVYDAQIVVNVEHFLQIYQESFKLTIQRSEPTTEEEISEKVNQPPYFDGYEYKNELPSIEVEVDREIFYELPEAMDRDGNDVNLRLEAGSAKIKSCQSCMELDLSSNGIVFTLTNEYQTELSTIYVYLSDSMDERQYFFYL